MGDSARVPIIAAPITLSYRRPTVSMSSIPPPTFPLLNLTSQPSASAPPAMDSNNPHFMASFADMNMANVPTMPQLALGPQLVAHQPFPRQRANPGTPPNKCHRFPNPLQG